MYNILSIKPTEVRYLGDNCSHLPLSKVTLNTFTASGAWERY